MRVWHNLAWLGMVVLIGGCSPSTSIPPTQSLTDAAPSLTEAVTAASTPEPAATATVTDAPPTLLPQPTAQPAADQLTRIVYIDRTTHLRAVNADGSNPALLSTDFVKHFALNPYIIDGETLIAYIATDAFYPPSSVALKLLSLPSSEVREITTLLAPDTTPPARALTSDEFEFFETLMASLLAEDSLQWSPDGKWLAFKGAMNDRATNVYSYEVATEQIRWLTSGSSHVNQMLWSPDSRLIAHTTFDGSLTCDECPLTRIVDGTWVASPDGITFSQLQEAATTELVGWLDANTLLAHSPAPFQPSTYLRSIDIETKQVTVLDPHCFDQVVFSSAEHATYLLFITDQTASFCNSLWSPGIFLISPDQVIRALETTRGFDSAEWLDSQGMFVLRGDDAAAGILPNGLVVENLTLPPAGSQVYEGGNLWVWIKDTERLFSAHAPDFVPTHINPADAPLSADSSFAVLP